MSLTLQISLAAEIGICLIRELLRTLLGGLCNTQKVHHAVIRKSTGLGLQMKSCGASHALLWSLKTDTAGEPPDLLKLKEQTATASPCFITT